MVLDKEEKVLYTILNKEWMVVIMQVLKEEIQERILDASQKLFLQYGYEKTSIEKIARQAKISKSNLYNYFKSKDDIFNKLTDQAAYEFREIIDFFSSNRFEPKFSVSGFEEMMTNEIFKLVSQNREGLLLLVFCAQGTRYVNLKDELVGIITKKFKADYKAYFPDDDNVVLIITQNLFDGITNLTMRSQSDEILKQDLRRLIHYHSKGFSALISD